MKNLSWLETSSDKIDDSVYKNGLLCCVNDEYFCIYNKDRINRSQIENKIIHEKALEYEDVIVVCAGMIQEAVEVSFQELINNYTVDIVAIVVKKSLINKAGYYNESINALTDYEMLCRIAAMTDRCIFVFDNIEETALNVTDQEILCWAYMVRRYMYKLRNWNILNEFIEGMFELASQCNMQMQFSETLNRMISDDNFYKNIAWDTAPIVIFHGDDTCHGVLRDFADQLMQGLVNIGKNTIALDSGNIDFDYLQNNVIKALVGFQSNAFKIDYFKKMETLKLQFWFDNPVFYKQHFRTLPDECYFLCQDANYAKYISDYYNKKNTLQFPPAGHLQCVDKDAERPYDIVFIAGFLSESNGGFDDFSQAYYDYMIEHPTLTFSDGFMNLCSDYNIETEGIDLSELMTDLRPACQAIINHYRKKVVDTILAAGYQIHVYGDSWEKYHSQWEENLIIHPEVNVEESLAEWQKAKIGLNVMSWHKAGMTERIANIMLAGAVCLSDETDYLVNNFEVGKQIECFSLGRVEGVVEKIAELLRDNHWKEIALDGYEVAKEKHTWNKRAEELNALIEKKNVEQY